MLGNDIVGALDHGRTVFERGFHVVDAGDFLEIERDELHGLLGDVEGFGSNQGEWFAVIANPLADQDLLIGLEPCLAGLAGMSVGASRSGSSAEVSTQTTPGRARAFETSIRRSLALASGLRSATACSMPGML